MLVVKQAQENSVNGNGARPLMCRGVRGAITVETDSPEEILTATRELLDTITRLNGMNPDEIASVYFTTTKDLTSTYPALAARQIGWYDVALICGHEMEVPQSLRKCIRVLLHWNTTKSAQEIAHVYMREAVSLRPDLVNRPMVKPIQMSPMDAALKMLGSRVA